MLYISSTILRFSTIFIIQLTRHGRLGDGDTKYFKYIHFFAYFYSFLCKNGKWSEVPLFVYFVFFNIIFLPILFAKNCITMVCFYSALQTLAKSRNCSVPVSNILRSSPKKMDFYSDPNPNSK